MNRFGVSLSDRTRAALMKSADRPPAGARRPRFGRRHPSDHLFATRQCVPLPEIRRLLPHPPGRVIRAQPSRSEPSSSSDPRRGDGVHPLIRHAATEPMIPCFTWVRNIRKPLSNIDLHTSSSLNPCSKAACRRFPPTPTDRNIIGTRTLACTRNIPASGATQS